MSYWLHTTCFWIQLAKFGRRRSDLRFHCLPLEIPPHDRFQTFPATVLGPDSVAACNYSFPYTDPVSFAGRQSSCSSPPCVVY